LGKMDTPASRQWLRRLMASANIPTRLYAAIALLKAGESVDPSVWTSIAKDRDTRLALYGKLKDIEKLKYFPKEYLSQRDFAESLLLDTFEDETPSGVKFLREATATFKGKTRKFLLYRVDFEDDDGTISYLGVAGFYGVNSKAILPGDEDNYSGYYDGDEYTPGLENKLLTAYLKGFTESGHDEGHTEE
jgi:hypothetical protein